jgi:hypothetical protein
MCAKPETEAPPLNALCPWDGEPISSAWQVQLRDMTLSFCSQRCMERFRGTSPVFFKPWRLV